jgi:pyridoxine 5'-phosphate synthase PdxJ
MTPKESTVKHMERAAARGVEVGAEVQAGHQLAASRFVLFEQINGAAARAGDRQIALSTPMAPKPPAPK